jgi:predicted acylesterase/phospholipase RssA
MKREFFGGGGRPGISSVMVDAFNIMQDRITRARLAGDPPDLLISPRVGKIGWFDFHRADDLIAHGAARGRTRHRIDPGGDPHSGAADGGRRRAGGRKRPIRNNDQAVLM